MDMTRYALSSSQREIWFDQMLFPDTPLYNIGGYVRIDGPVDPEMFAQAARHVMRANDALRIRLHRHDLVPMQTFDNDAPCDVPFDDYSAADDPDQRAIAWMEREFAKPFALYDRPLFRYALLKADARRFYWFKHYSHLIVDGWSISLLTQRMAAAYNALLAGKTDESPPPQYRVFIADDQAYLASDKFDASAAYWQAKYRAIPEPLIERSDAPTDRAAILPSDIAYLWLKRDLYDRLTALAQTAQASTLHVFIAALYIYFLRMTGRADLVVGLPTLNRRNTDFKQTVGLFMGVNPNRFAFGSDVSVTELLRGISRELRQDYRHQRFPVSEINKFCKLLQQGRRNLFDIRLSYEKHEYDTQFDGHPVEAVTFLNGYEQDALAMFVREFHAHQDVRVDFSYNLGAFAAHDIELLKARLAMLFEEMLTHPDMAVDKLNFLPAEERERLVVAFNATTTPYPETETLPSLFEAQVANHPERIALVCSSANAATLRLTYADLNRRVNRVAHYLRDTCAIRPDEPVALLVERSAWMLIGMLGIVKAGGAYLPIDPTYPAERVAYMLHDSQCCVILTDAAQRVSLLSDCAELTVLDVHAVAHTRTDNPRPRITPDNLAYVTYTSGSTGKPKGVMITHRNVISFAANFTRVFGLTPDDTMYALTTFTFDISVLELLGSLLFGMRVVLEIAAMPDDAATTIAREQITVLQATPSKWQALFDACGTAFAKQLRVGLVGGEALSRHLFETLRRIPELVMFNVYGPTETTIWSSAKRLDDSALTIGAPLCNETLYVLGEDGALLPIGAIGEIYIGGAGVGRGYWQRPDLTAEKFAPHPFQPGERLYRTGDVGRWLPNGEMEFIGRRDDQVKIRGFRIELGEIEYRLRQHPAILDAVVVAKEFIADNRELAAYLVWQPQISADNAPSLSELRTYLSRTLPEYMLPSYFVVLECIPLTPNNKVDRKALPMPDGYPLRTMQTYIAPSDDVETPLAAIWETVLNRAPISITENFFELGGHSLKAMQILAKVAQQLSVEVTLQELLAAPTIRSLAIIMRGKVSRRFAPIAPLPPAVSYPLSHAQRRLWVLDQFASERVAYNIPAAFLLTGDLDLTAFRAAFAALMARHESLRTGFVALDDTPQQIIHAAFAVPLTIMNLQDAHVRLDLERRFFGTHTGCVAVETLARAYAVRDAVTPFDLASPPLFRIALLTLTAGQRVFVFAMHHIISDRWSLDVFARELQICYQAYRGNAPETVDVSAMLPPLRVQYKDYAAWQNELLASASAESLRAYWQRKLAGNLPLSNLPADFPRPDVKTTRGAALTFAFDPDLTAGLKAFGAQQSSSLFMVLLALVKILLYRYTDEEDVIVGAPVAGRNHPETEHQIGLYLNTLALRDRIHGNASFESVLQAIRQTVTEAFDHQAYPFDRLVDELNIPRDARRHPLFDVLVNLREREFPALTFEGLHVAPFVTESHTSKFDLAITFDERADHRIGVTFEYRADLFAPERMQRMIAHFVNLARAMLAAPQQAINACTMLTDTERQFYDTFAQPLPLTTQETVLDLFAARMQAHPEHPAIVEPGGVWNYGALAAKSDELARLLMRLGVGSDVVAGAMFGADSRQILALLAIFKAAGVYMAFEPDARAGRLEKLLAQAQPRVIFADETEIPRLAAACANHTDAPEYLISVNITWSPRVYAHQGQNYQPVVTEINAAPLPNIAPAAACYLFFTSGSTGEPKGILGVHQSLAQFIRWEISEFGLDATCHVSHLINPAFDASLRDIFAPLCSGGTLHIPSVPTRANLHTLAAWLSAERITLMHIVPALLRPLMQAAENLPNAHNALAAIRYVLISGEPLYVQDVAHWRALCGNRAELVNLYGVTETTMIKTFYRVGATDQIASPRLPAGKPIANAAVAVLNNGQPCAIGEVGEIFLKSPYITKGYYRQPELTAQVFAPNPLTGAAGDIVYKTGDLGRYLSDGSLEVLGRRDAQIKANGIRIELGEIEQQLLRHPAISAATVIADEQQRLIAYIIPKPSAAAPDQQAVQTYLRETLPDYMIPAIVMALTEFPLTATGKVDRHALPAPDVRTAVAYTPPQTDIEQNLAAIWQELLGQTRIGTHDNFFELGGQSLKATQVVSRIHRDLNLTVDLQTVYQHPTIADLATELENIRWIACPKPGETGDTGVEEVLI